MNQEVEEVKVQQEELQRKMSKVKEKIFALDEKYEAWFEEDLRALERDTSFLEKLSKFRQMKENGQLTQDILDVLSWDIKDVVKWNEMNSPTDVHLVLQRVSVPSETKGFRNLLKKFVMRTKGIPEKLDDYYILEHYKEVLELTYEYQKAMEKESYEKSLEELLLQYKMTKASDQINNIVGKEITQTEQRCVSKKLEQNVSNNIMEQPQLEWFGKPDPKEAPPVDVNEIIGDNEECLDMLCTHGKEFYHGYCGYGFQAHYFNERIFYVHEHYICSINMEGKGVRIIAENEKIDPDTTCLAVNEKGIFVYQFKCMDYNGFSDGNELYWYDFQGNIIKKIKVSGSQYMVTSSYICGSRLFYVLGKNLEEDDDSTKCSAYCLDMETGEKITLCSNAREITKVYGNYEKAVFYVWFQKSFKDGKYSESGWYMYEFNTGELSSLDNAMCPPHYIMKDIRTYRKLLEQQEEENIQEKEILFFDMKRDLMWTKKELKRGQKVAYYMVPERIVSNVEVVPTKMCGKQGIEIWKISDNYNSSYSSYFNGEYFFSAETYYKFKSYNRNGEECVWYDEQHGECDAFRVFGRMLHLNGRMYIADFQKQKPMYEINFAENEIPQEAIRKFEAEK